MTEEQRGRLLVLSGPSGSGKTTVGRRLLDRHGGVKGRLVRSVSVTTRPRRAGEVDGDDYQFVTEEHFLFLLAAGELLEHAELYGFRYGTPRAFVEDSLKQQHDVLLILDPHGRQQLTSRLSAPQIGVFLLPPSAQELEKRLRGRNQDDAETVATRLTAAREEMARCVEYDYVIRNRDLTVTLQMLDTILRHEHGRSD